MYTETPLSNLHKSGSGAPPISSSAWLNLVQIAQVFNRLIFYVNIFHILIYVVKAYIFHILYGKLPLMKAFSHINICEKISFIIGCKNT